MAYLSKGDGNVLAPGQFPPPQPLALQLVQHLGNGQVNQTTSTTLTQNNACVQAFKGKLMALGITEVVVACIIIIIGIIEISVVIYPLNYRDFSVIIGTPWWSGGLFIIAGSLAIAVEREPTHCMIRGCLGMNIISAIACFPAVIIYSVNLAFPGYCYSINCFHHQGTIPCLAILLLLTLLIAAISISVSSFNCKAINCCCATPEPVVIVYNTTTTQQIPTQQFQPNPPPYNMAAMAPVYAG
ncbi:membrane-spanning 4-domains subfamily A member 4D-like isoform X1 [Carcharodon carcharias]|uniref:membrane-spanning 4-domains subfamily A member 4D-like isoform X1 n=1 Tax=Carcharodon carcharias TaxID=13397 RepID=UPI001B7ED9B3|nr:membrane-spanning 4-domains subfamily A member 4D-like isoform X1 [Carcharodon carcharias]XP_041034473.1 membrane-spanning 4-domains subfamily A member 4D-like isoform X1 [Carcharodon carcharias]